MPAVFLGSSEWYRQIKYTSMKVWLIYKGAGKFFYQFTAQKFKSQIKIFSCRCIANFFGHQYRREELMDLLEFLNGNNQQRNNKSKTNTSSWVWLDLPSHTQISLNFTKVSLDDLRGGVNLKDFKKWNFNIFYTQGCITKVVLTNQIAGFFDH